MAFKRGGSNKPQYSISTSVFIRKGKYAKGPSFGLWLSDNGPMARGTVKEEYLDDLISFIKKAASNEQGVSFALFKNKPKRDEDDGEYRSRRDRDEDDEDEKEERSSKRRKREEEDEDDAGKGSKKSGSKKGGKKDDWGFDDDDD